MLRLRVKSALTASVALGALVAASAVSAQELRYMCYQDGSECDVTRALLDQFEADNPGITVVVDTVPYQAVLDNLPVQLAAGEGPDMARVTDLGGLNQYYLDMTPYVDASYWEANFGQTLNWLRSGPDDAGIYGMMTQLTITGPYVNATLYELAGMDMPGEGATWDDWAESSRAVAEALEIPFPMAMDRSGHRFAGPAMSNGAAYFDADGAPILVDDGFRDFAATFVGWHEDGTMPVDVWGGAGGGTYRDAFAEFSNGNLVFYMSGSWQIGRMENDIGDGFDWMVVDNPCGVAGCTAMPGGAAMVAFAHTEHPEAVSMVIDFLAQQDSYSAMMAQTNQIPAHLGVASAGVDFTAGDDAAAALSTFSAQVPNLLGPAFALQGYRFNRAVYNATVTRLTQAIVGELSLDDALVRIDQDIADALATAAQ